MTPGQEGGELRARGPGVGRGRGGKGGELDLGYQGDTRSGEGGEAGELC